jgi:hypothetical protein
MKVIIFITVICSLSFRSHLICLEDNVEHLSHPTLKKPENAVNVTQLQYAKSAKEIVTAVGTFYPTDKSHDFTQTFQVLLRYRKSKYFLEKKLH